MKDGEALAQPAYRKNTFIKKHLNGYIQRVRFTGSYTLQLPGNISATSNFVIDNGGREIQIINVTNGRVLSGVARKQ